ncbi:MAG: hypothetical protein KAI50_11175 [Desulfobacterales bacterium]|nr:hypothetical protein [Desulfobacterales bacterium]
MLIRGAIFLAENFVFSDNTTGKKLLILLNNPTSDDPYFLVKTTSQQHAKPKTLVVLKIIIKHISSMLMTIFLKKIRGFNLTIISLLSNHTLRQN